jgi:hypothetical protein
MFESIKNNGDTINIDYHLNGTVELWNQSTNVIITGDEFDQLIAQRNQEKS